MNPAIHQCKPKLYSSLMILATLEKRGPKVANHHFFFSRLRLITLFFPLADGQTLGFGLNKRRVGKASLKTWGHACLVLLLDDSIALKTAKPIVQAVQGVQDNRGDRWFKSSRC